MRGNSMGVTETIFPAKILPWTCPLRCLVHLPVFMAARLFKN